MRDVMQWNRRGVFCLIAVLIIGLGGCTGKKSTTSMEGDDGEMATLASSVSNYNDIELPAEMKQDAKKTLSIATDSFRGGIIHYTGKVEINSLKDFIIASMKKNKWKLVGEVASQNIILAFTKPNKTCMMNLIDPGSLRATTVDMYVTVDVAAARSLNAFGEPIK